MRILGLQGVSECRKVRGFACDSRKLMPEAVDRLRRGATRVHMVVEAEEGAIRRQQPGAGTSGDSLHLTSRTLRNYASTYHLVTPRRGTSPSKTIPRLGVLRRLHRRQLFATPAPATSPNGKVLTSPSRQHPHQLIPASRKPRNYGE